MKKFVFLFVFSILLFSCKNDQKKILVESKACEVVNVMYFGPGTRHSMQTSPEWHVTTDCGVALTLQRSIEVGDSIWIHTFAIK